MKRNTFTCVGLVFLLLCGCNNQSENKRGQSSDNLILQQDDGTISLKLDNAACYSDVTDPSSNTAEWKMSIEKPGRYKVWLSSATKDTLALNYINAVKVSLLDNELKVNPVCDKIVQHSDEISYPFYRADSYLGAFYIQEPGIYTIQLISEKVLPKELREQTASLSDSTRLMSVFLVPLTR